MIMDDVCLRLIAQLKIMLKLYNFIRKFTTLMFTGIVKLAQVDDYISPSQNCIQPKIMKPTEKEKATVTLNDCLACSGCLTSAESVLVEQMSVAKLISELNKQSAHQVHFIVAPQVVLSISRAYGISPTLVFAQLNYFFKKHFSTGQVFDLWEGIIHCHQLILQEYLESKGRTILCSECPGWVCYAEKTLTEGVVSLMSRVKSPQQIMGNILKERSRECMVVTIMPCYDKKLEAIRFDIEAGLKEVDITITTVELLDLYRTITGQNFAEVPLKYDDITVDRLLAENEGKPYCLIDDPVSNGYVQYLIKSLQGQMVTKKQIKNSDFIEYQLIAKGEKIKMAKCYGFRNIQKVVQSIKKGKCQYRYVEIMACPGGCYSGGGQIKAQNKKPKEVWEEMTSLAKGLIAEPAKLNIQALNLSKKDGYYTTYKVIEKTLTQSVMNW